MSFKKYSLRVMTDQSDNWRIKDSQKLQQSNYFKKTQQPRRQRQQRKPRKEPAKPLPPDMSAENWPSLGKKVVKDAPTGSWGLGNIIDRIQNPEQEPEPVPEPKESKFLVLN